jgi:hypothetical protein
MTQSQVSYKELVQGKEYIVNRAGDTFKIIWKGTFRGEYQRYFEDHSNLIFVNCIRKVNINLGVPDYGIMNIGSYEKPLIFRKNDIFHDIEKIKDNRKKAIENMEKRALDKILKILVNEYFEW